MFFFQKWSPQSVLSIDYTKSHQFSKIRKFCPLGTIILKGKERKIHYKNEDISLIFMKFEKYQLFGRIYLFERCHVLVLPIVQLSVPLYGSIHPLSGMHSYVTLNDLELLEISRSFWLILAIIANFTPFSCFLRFQFNCKHINIA